VRDAPLVINIAVWDLLDRLSPTRTFRIREVNEAANDTDVGGNTRRMSQSLTSGGSCFL